MKMFSNTYESANCQTHDKSFLFVVASREGLAGEVSVYLSRRADMA